LFHVLQTVASEGVLRAPSYFGHAWPMARYVLHMDLDQFIAAVEMLRRPEIRDKPVVVGGDGDPTKRGVVSTANYQARRFGIRSAMPLRTAFKRAPEAGFEVMGRQPTSELWGIGKKTAPKLEALGIRTVEELATADEEMLAARFGPSTGPWLRRLGTGEDDSPVRTEPYVARGRGRER